MFKLHSPRRRSLGLGAVLAAGALIVSACSSSSTGSNNAGGNSGGGGGSSNSNSNLPSWCGSKKVTLGLTDGFGDNSWRIVTTASAKDEIKKCPNVTQFFYADGQGNTQKAISDIQGMVAKGVNALVVFPDAGKAILPALRSAYKAGVVTVPYRVFPGGKDGVDYNVFIGTDFVQAGQQWGNWIKKVLPNGGNVLMLSGPAGNSQGVDENKGLHQVLDPTGKYHFIGQQPFEITNWDPSLTQQVLTADIAKYSKIDVIVHDFGPTLVSSLPQFAKSGRPIPALATSDGNSLGCFWQQNHTKYPSFKLMTVSTQNDHARLAIDWAVALATGGQKPSTKVFPNTIFEDSTTGKPHPVECDKNLPPDIYLSAQLPAQAQAKLVTK
jgi:ribose transport system substrate-binding protein